MMGEKECFLEVMTWVDDLGWIKVIVGIEVGVVVVVKRIDQ